MFKHLAKYKIQKKSTYKKTLLLTTIVGSIIGAGVALFSSPTSGSQNRRLAVKKSQQLAGYTKDKITMLEEQAKKAGSSLGNEMEKEIKQISDMAGELATSTRENLSKVAEKLSQAIISVKSKLNKDTDVEIINKIDNIGKKATQVVEDSVEAIRPKK
ncbi:MAG: YtxH domain-containing protein [Candidatus Parcubacteria bacterium]|nr:YtxH domain-containing protein [Candidatus Paceibacterota bacterium]